MDFATIAASWDWITLQKILGVNLILSGDNAVLIALAAAGLPAAQRSKAILFGMVLAVVLRVVLSLAAVYLLAIPGIMLAGGLVLLWIAYSFFKELRHKDQQEASGEIGEVEPKTMAVALRQIVSRPAPIAASGRPSRPKGISRAAISAAGMIRNDTSGSVARLASMPSGASRPKW